MNNNIFLQEQIDARGATNYMDALPSELRNAIEVEAKRIEELERQMKEYEQDYEQLKSAFEPSSLWGKEDDYILQEVCLKFMECVHPKNHPKYWKFRNELCKSYRENRGPTTPTFSITKMFELYRFCCGPLMVEIVDRLTNLRADYFDAEFQQLLISKISDMKSLAEYRAKHGEVMP